MSLTNKDTNQNVSQKDVLYNSNPVSLKGQKILAALYLITGHLADADPLKINVRNLAVNIVLTPRPFVDDFFVDPIRRAIFFDALHDIGMLLDGAYLAKLITEKNYEMLKAELTYYGKSVEGLSKRTDFNKGHLKDISNQKSALRMDKGHAKGHLINSYLQKDPLVIEENKKTDRTNKIVDFIKSKKIVSIKDISGLFPFVSEKTIQRELNRLIGLGKIKKKGNKRWSLYLSLDATD